MKKLLLPIALTFLAQAAHSGGISHPESVSCGVTHEAIMDTKYVDLKTSDILDQVTIKADLVKSLVACAGNFGTGYILSEMKIALSVRNSSLQGSESKEVLSNYLNKVRTTFKLNADLLKSKPLYRETVRGDVFLIEPETVQELQIDSLTAHEQFLSTGDNVGKISATLNPDLMPIADYFEEATVKIDGVPEIKFSK